MTWRFDNSYLTVPSSMYSKAQPEMGPHSEWIVQNETLAQEMGLSSADLWGERGVFWGGKLPPGAHPVAQAYGGHQFGHFNILGDGRAHLLGEHISPEGTRFDIHLKGSGKTPYSRGGDGQATLGPMLREYIISQAFFHLGIPCTRSLGVLSTGQLIHRDRSLPGAILVRVAASHIRVGTLEYAAALGDLENLRHFVDYVIWRHDPEVLETANPYQDFLKRVVERQAYLIARWMNIGFIHGVMNTDNMTISGETLDLGPCAFMDAFQYKKVFSSIDSRGRYAYGNQPRIGQWNLARLAEAILPLLHEEPKVALQMATEIIESFEGTFQKYWRQGLRFKLGLFQSSKDIDKLGESFFEILNNNQLDFTNSFRGLTRWIATFGLEDLNPRNIPLELQNRDILSIVKTDWFLQWKGRLKNSGAVNSEIQALMEKNNPAIIPRNHKVEEALSAAVEGGDLGPTQALLRIIEKPYDHDLPESDYHRPPQISEQESYRTFCGI